MKTKGLSNKASERLDVSLRFDGWDKTDFIEHIIEVEGDLSFQCELVEEQVEAIEELKKLADDLKKINRELRGYEELLKLLLGLLVQK